MEILAYVNFFVFDEDSLSSQQLNYRCKFSMDHHTRCPRKGGLLNRPGFTGDRLV
jgi:hypothetical protein